MTLFFATLSAQTYVGTMTLDGYVQKNVVAELTVEGSLATLEMKQVKFSRFMPVKVDVTLDSIRVVSSVDAETGATSKAEASSEIRLQGEGIKPLSKGKRFDKFIVTQGRGTAGKTCNFSCLMGDKKVTFKGVRK